MDASPTCHRFMARRVLRSRRRYPNQGSSEVSLRRCSAAGQPPFSVSAPARRRRRHPHRVQPLRLRPGVGAAPPCGASALWEDLQEEVARLEALADDVHHRGPRQLPADGPAGHRRAVRRRANCAGGGGEARAAARLGPRQVPRRRGVPSDARHVGLPAGPSPAAGGARLC